MHELTKSEEQVMQILWNLNKAFVKEIVAEFSEPKPAYNTVSTIIRILEKKKIVGYEPFGRTHRYFPLFSREAYANQSANYLIENYFGGSAENLVSFFMKEKNISASELEQIMEQIKKS